MVFFLKKFLKIFFRIQFFSLKILLNLACYAFFCPKVIKTFKLFLYFLGLTHKLFTTLTVKRSFTVVNSGEVAFTIVNISINNVACENRGFRILNCHPFRLKPNETHILDVA